MLAFAPGQTWPAGGFQTDQWYYVAGVYTPAVIERDANGTPIWEEDANGNPVVGRPANTIQNGSESLYLWDGTNLVSETTVPDTILVYGFQSGWHVDNFRLRGTYIAGNSLMAMDDFSILDKAFDEEGRFFTSFVSQLLNALSSEGLVKLPGQLPVR